jgi:uncharacterized protein YggE
MRPFLLLCIALLVSPAMAEDNALRANTLTVHGEAITRVAPDQLTLPVTVREENVTLKVAKDRHDDKLRRLLKLAADLGIPKEKIQTSYTAVNPVYDYERESTRPRLRGYEVQTSLEFRLTDFAKLGDFMNGIIAAGIDEIGSVSYSLQDEDKAREDTLNLAMEQAYAKASRLAGTAKVTIDKPLIIEEGDADVQRPMRPRPMMRMAAMNAPMAAAPPELPSGVIEIHQAVTVTYALK